jgi:phage gp29-like protein
MGWDLTPERIASAWVVAEQGDPRTQYSIMDDAVERDLTLGSLVEARTDALAGKAIVVQPGAQDMVSRAGAEMFRAEVWSRLDVPSLVRTHQYSPNLYGFAASEIDWQFDQETRRIDPMAIWYCHPQDFLIATTYNPRVRGAQPDELLVRRTYFDPVGEQLMPGKWIVTRRTVTTPLARAGVGRGAVWWSHLKQIGVADWAVFVRRYGLPFVLATINDWTSMEERAQAEDILRRIGDDGGAIKAKNSLIGIEFLDGAQGSRNTMSDLHERLAAFCDIQQAKRWNGAALASESGQGAHSYAQARVHDGIRVSLLEADAIRLERSIREHLIVPWWQLNNLPGTPARVKFHLTAISDPRQFAETADIVVNKLGIGLSKEQILEAVGMREAAGPGDAATGQGSSGGEAEPNEDEDAA